MKKKVIIICSIVILTVLVTLGVFKMSNKEKNNSNNEIINKNDNNFNLNLIKTVNNNKTENYLISPYSIEIALKLLKAGANNNTLKEIENVIGSRSINDVTVKDRISVANAAFIKNKYKQYVLDAYYNILKDKYNSEILYDDYNTPKVINDWVNKKTNGMIENVLDNIDESFVLGLANALAIDVEWDTPFNCGDTTSQKFTKNDNTTINVEMMHKVLEYDGYKYLKNNNATGVIIPYKKYDKTSGDVDYDNDSNLEFIAILPNDKVNNYINNLTEAELNDLFNSAKSTSNTFNIKLSLPRFKYDYELENFKEVLKTLGIKEAFDPNKADFTNIMPRNDEIDNLYVGTAIHKTHIDLNEKGTKAAAVTFFGLYKNTAMQVEKETIDIVFDKPFIYMIRDKKTSELLFFGVVHEPNKWHGTTCSDNN